MKTTTQTMPLTAHAVRQMVNSLSLSLNERAAALHLALPVGEVAQISVRTIGRSWRYRGVDLTWSDDAVTDAVTLVALAHQVRDTYLDPAGRPVDWVKVVRSGVHQVVFGGEVLLDVPKMSLEVGVDTEVAHELLERLSAGKDVAGVLDLGTLGTVLVEGGKDGMLVRNTNGSYLGTITTGDHDVVGCGKALAEELKAPSWSAEVAGSSASGLIDVNYSFLVEGRTLLVPVMLGPSSEVVGVARGAYTEEEGHTIGSFQMVGKVVDGDETVVRHVSSGIVGLSCE